jgi:hypothetical protein
MIRNNRPYRCLGDFGIWSAQNVRWIGKNGEIKKDVFGWPMSTIAMDALNSFNSLH